VQQWNCFVSERAPSARVTTGMRSAGADRAGDGRLKWHSQWLPNARVVFAVTDCPVPVEPRALRGRQGVRPVGQSERKIGGCGCESLAIRPPKG